MQKDEIFLQRKEMKQKSHAVVRSHYVVLVFLTLILIMFGTEFNYNLMGWGKLTSDTSENDPGNLLSAGDVYSYGDVWNDIISGNLDEGNTKAEKISAQMKDNPSSEMLGRSNGVLAMVINTLFSGQLISKLGLTVRTLLHSNEAVALIFIAGSFLLYAFVFVFLKNAYSAVIRRIYLEARVYKYVSFLDVTFFLAVRKWFNIAMILLLQYVYTLLWSLTIVGGLIKWFSYFAVPYIAAENPTMKPKEVIALSRKMMNGHKMELFKYTVSMLGWILLGIITFGISDMLYGTPYRLANYTEFYVKIREAAIREGIEGTEKLYDRYLFEQADRILLYETYFDVVDEITLIHENKVEFGGWKRKIADWFGIWLGTLEEKKAYDNQEGRTFAIRRLKRSMSGEAYPEWLNPLWQKREVEKTGNFSFLRNYSVWTLFLLFITFCFVGWIWEVALHFMQTGQFANRGTLHGPWLPIYGTGGVIVLILCSRFRKNPVAEFFTAVLLCGILEYTSGWFLEMKYHQRWWSYDGYFLNLHGRICAEGLLVFGIGCCAVVYLLAPMFDFLLSMVKQKILIGVCLVLLVIYGADVAYSSGHPNMAEGAVEAAEAAEFTEKKKASA